MRKLALVLMAPLLTLAFATSCGSDDDSSASTSTSETEETGSTGATDSTGSTSPWSATDEFCDAQQDLAAAQDGAQRNTAIGEMQDALTEDAPPAIAEALNTLLTGDLASEAYTAAESALAAACS